MRTFGLVFLLSACGATSNPPADAPSAKRDSSHAADSSDSSRTDSSDSSRSDASVWPRDFVLTWYSFQDNTPSNSAFSSSGRTLVPYVSVALPFRFLASFGGPLHYGDTLFVSFLEGRVMPNGQKHSGWVRVDDFCGDNSDDSYCYQSVGGTLRPNVDLWIGDFTASGMNSTSCVGPAGGGQEPTVVSVGTPPSALVTDYGGRSLGRGKCGHSSSARNELGECWDYTPPAETASACSSCTSSTCAP